MDGSAMVDQNVVEALSLSVVSRFFPLSPFSSVFVYLSPRLSVSLSPWLSVSISLHLSLSRSLPLYLPLSLSISISLSLSLSVSLVLSLSLSLSVNLSTYLKVSNCAKVSFKHVCIIHPSIHPPTHPSIRASIHPYPYPTISLSISLYLSLYLPTRVRVGTTFRPLLHVPAPLCMAGAMDSAPCEKRVKRVVLQQFQTRWQRGTFDEALHRCFSHGRRKAKDTWVRHVRRPGRWFPERGCILEHQLFRFAEMILRDRCSTSYDLASLFRGRRSTLGRWSGKIAKRIGTRPSTLHSTFHVWRKSRRIDSFLMLPTLNIEEVWQNCFVLELCASMFEEVSRNCIVSDRQLDRIDRYTEVDRDIGR